MWISPTQPYPISDSKASRIFTILGMGFFVYLFLFIFRPFGLQSLTLSSEHAILAGYGLVCSSVLLIDLFLIPLLFPKIFIEENWTVGKEFLFIMWNVVTVGIANAIYTQWIWKQPFSFSFLLAFQFFTITVAILPVTLLILTRQIALLRKNLKAAHELSDTMTHKKRLTDIVDIVTLEAENPRDSFKLESKELLFINAADNYIEIHYTENNIAKTKLIRSTLKTARENLRHSNAFYRCHRAWIVNLDRVKSVTGNSQGYRLIMEYSDIQVPVSRNLNPELSLRLAK